jgi:hypothetical protein
MNNRKVWVLLTVVFLLAGTASWAAQTKAPTKTAPAAQGKATEKPKEHQATGAVVSSSATSLVISKAAGKGKSEWTFVVTPKIKTQGPVAKGAKVTVYYHEEKDQKIADRIKVWEATPATKAPAKTTKGKS